MRYVSVPDPSRVVWFAMVLLENGPVLILLSRGFLLGRMWAMRPAMDNPCGKDEGEFES